MTLEKLKEEVLSQAEKQAKSVLSEAEREEEKILEEAKGKAKTLVSEKQKLGETQAKEMGVELRASALLQAKRMESEAKEEAVQNVVSEIKEELEKISKSSSYDKIFDSLVKQAIRELHDKDFVLKVNSRDKKLASKYGKVAETVDTIGGAIVAKADGTIQINATFEALLEEKEEELKQKAFEELFGRNHSGVKTQKKVSKPAKKRKK